MEGKRWYSIQATLAHQGAGKFHEIPIYVWVRNPVVALNRYKCMPGLKKRGRASVRPLNENESAELEKMIADDGLNLHEIKNKWNTSADEYKFLLWKHDKHFRR